MCVCLCVYVRWCVCVLVCAWVCACVCVWWVRESYSDKLLGGCQAHPWTKGFSSILKQFSIWETGQAKNFFPYLKLFIIKLGWLFLSFK